MKKEAILILLTCLLGAESALAAGNNNDVLKTEARMSMLDEIQADMRQVMGRELSPDVAGAILRVPRHEFVPEHLAARAYGNHPLPIGEDQTISQPLIVALMTDLLSLGESARVLEVGTGSGYQAAVLAELSDHVYTVEIIDALAREARTRLLALDYDNVSVRHGDGLLGWPEAAPFDGIIVTAAGLEVPDSLLAQLKIGGKMVIPVGEQYAVQQLKVVDRTPTGYTETNVLPVRFVPITRDIR